MIKLAAATEAALPAAQPGQVSGNQPNQTLPQPLAQFADVFKNLLDQVHATSIANDAGDQAEAIVAQLKTQLATTLQPLLADVPPAGNKYGPVQADGRTARQQAGPYQESGQDTPAEKAAASTVGA